MSFGTTNTSSMWSNLRPSGNHDECYQRLIDNLQTEREIGGKPPKSSMTPSTPPQRVTQKKS